MEPVTLFMVALHQAILALVSIKARQDDVPVNNEAASVVIDGARALGLVLSVTFSEKVGRISLNPLIDFGKTALEVVCDIARDSSARNEFNKKIVAAMGNRPPFSTGEWLCPRSKRTVSVTFEGSSLSVSCPYLLPRPPLGCKVTWKKLALIQIAFPPLIFVTMMKAFFDFTLLSFGGSPWKTYGYCCLADRIIRGVS